MGSRAKLSRNGYKVCKCLRRWVIMAPGKWACLQNGGFQVSICRSSNKIQLNICRSSHIASYSYLCTPISRGFSYVALRMESSICIARRCHGGQSMFGAIASSVPKGSTMYRGGWWAHRSTTYCAKILRSYYRQPCEERRENLEVDHVNLTASWSIVHSVYNQNFVLYIVLMCYPKNVV